MKRYYGLTSRPTLLKMFFAFFILCLIAFLYRPIAPWLGIHGLFEKSHKVIDIKNLNYRSDNEGNNKPLIYNLVSQEGNSATHIFCKFKIKKMHDSMDLFQTAPLNTGVRVKISKEKQMLTVLLGASIADDKFVAFEIGPKLLPNQWHSLKIDIWDKRYVQIRLDDYPVSRFLNTDLNVPNLDYQLSQIEIGGGSSPERQFDGEIADFSLENNVISYWYEKYVRCINTFFKLLFLGLVLGLGSYLLLTSEAMQRETKIEYLATMVLIGFFCAVVFHYIVAYYYHGTYPLDTFIFKIIGGQFGDFSVSLLTNYKLDPYHSLILRGEYFPFAYVLIYPFVWLQANIALSLYSLFFLFSVYIFFRYSLGDNVINPAGRMARWKNCFILSFMSFPVLFCFERGNLEGLLFALVALALFFYQKKNRIATVGFLAMASAIKLYPVLFILLFISDKRYIEAIGTIGLTLLLTGLSMFVLEPSWHQNLLSMWGSITGLTHNCVYLSGNCIQYSVSLWAPLKIIYLKHLSHLFSIDYYAKMYHLLAFVLGAVTVFYILFVEKQRWRKLFLIVGIILLLPIFSASYKMLYLFFPLALWVNAPPKGDDLWYFMGCSLLLIPKNYCWIRVLGQVLSINEPLNTVILSIIAISIMAQGTLCKLRKNTDKK